MITRPRLGIYGQILLVAVIPVAVITVILIFLIYRGTIVQGGLALDRQGRLLAEQLAANLEYVLTTGAVEQIPDAVAATVDPSTEVLGTPVGRIVVTDRENEPLFTSGAEYAPESSETHRLFSWLMAMDDVKRFQASVYLTPLDIMGDTPGERRFLGSVTIEIPTAPIKAEVLNDFLRDLGLAGAALCVALGLASWIGWRLSGAIKEAADAILRIKRGDFDIRLQRKASSEISTLQEGVVLAAEAIGKSQERLERALNKARAEHEQALSALRVQTEAAERANKAKSLFLAKVSHEMRTPLYSIQGLAERLIKSAVHDSDEERDLGQILRATDMLNHTIGDILDFTQLEGGRYQPVAEPLDLRKEIETITDTVEVLAREKDLAIDVIVEADVPRSVIGDPKAFRAIVTNLVSNAVKFTERGRISIRAEASAGQPKDTVGIVLSVTDTGRGIPQHRSASIFQPFEQVDGGLDRRFGGSGLGLSIVRGYCERLGGSVNVTSEPRKGSVFTVRLPFQRGVVESKSESRSTASSAPAVTRQTPAARPLTKSMPPEHDVAGKQILVVEDFKVNRDVMSHQLRSHGLQVVEATDGDEAVQLAMQQEIDLILMDIQMPGKDGITAIREIRQFEKGKTLPIIGFTASADKLTHRQVIDAGADQVLTKPIGEADLIAAIHGLLKES